MFLKNYKSLEVVCRDAPLWNLEKLPKKIGCHESYPKGVSKITTNLVDYQYFGRGLLAS